MLQKILAATLVLAVAAICLACSKQDKNLPSGAPETSPQTDPAEETEPTQPPKDAQGNILKAAVSSEPIDPKAGPTENMLLRSIHYEGDPSRIAQKMDRAVHYYADAPATRIAFLGDSITAGSSATPKNQYPYQLISWWKEAVSTNVEYKNAGIGATDSYLAVHRVDKDVLAWDPDIIFIEFINDGDNSFYQATMESLIRRCLAHPTNPAVILVEMTREDGSCPQAVHSRVAEFYGIPVISYRDAVLPEILAGNMAWKDISPDNIHPNNTGHVLLGMLLSSYLDEILENVDSLPKEVSPFDPDSPTLLSDRYARATLYGRDCPELTVVESTGFGSETTNDRYRDGWTTENGGSITFQMEFQNLGLLYQRTVDGKSGIATITVDETRSYKFNGDFTGGWGNYGATSQVLSLDEWGMHTVTVTVPEGKRFQILRWMVS